MNDEGPQIHIMVDLETMGTAPGSALISIGAVKFTRENGITEQCEPRTTQNRFYRRIDLQSCVDAGLTINPSTVLWWLQQSHEARSEFAKSSEDLVVVLLAFTEWVGTDVIYLWGNGAAFDNVLLRYAYDRLRLHAPWKFYNDRCYRTVKNLSPDVRFEHYQVGTHHNALDDAESQAKHLLAIWEAQS